MIDNVILYTVTLMLSKLPMHELTSISVFHRFPLQTLKQINEGEQEEQENKAYNEREQGYKEKEEEK